MGGSKSALSSVTVWGAGVALVAGAAQLVGYTISPTDQAAIVNLIQNGVTLYASIASVVGGALAIWGRIRATKQVTGVVKAA